MKPMFALAFATFGALAMLAVTMPAGTDLTAAPVACSFTVHVTPPMTAAYGAPVTIQTQLVASSSACHILAASYRYSGLPPNVNPMSGAMFTFVPETPGFYHIAVVVTTNFGISSATTTLHVLPPQP
jgi:hypothetical protein